MSTVGVPSGTIAYEDTGGDGPVMVFGHGLLMDGRQWRKVLPQLPEYRCITPTLPMGAHTSPMRHDADLTETGMANILADFLDALDLDDVTLVLNDWGGGQFMISEGRDKRIGRMVLASVTAFDNYPPEPARPAALLCRMPGGGWVLSRMLGTRFFRHSRRAYGAMAKSGLPRRTVRRMVRAGRREPGDPPRPGEVRDRRATAGPTAGDVGADADFRSAGAGHLGARRPDDAPRACRPARRALSRRHQDRRRRLLDVDPGGPTRRDGAGAAGLRQSVAPRILIAKIRESPGRIPAPGCPCG